MLGSYVVCDGLQELPKDLEVDVQRGVEVAKFLRAKWIKAFTRGNRQTTIGFTIQRLHGAIATAESFVLDHDVSVPDSGDMVITGSTGDGSFTITLKSAATTRCTTKHKGVSTFTTYQFVGGGVTVG